MKNIILEVELKEANNKIYSTLVNNLLYKVQKPGQYLGIEWGHLITHSKDKSLKNWEDSTVHTALIYPDLYELGMSNFGTKILYQTINRYPEYLCDRAYSPMQDMEELLRKEQVPLWGWESFQPLKEFDLLGISLSYELSYTNVLNILELSQIEILAKDRKDLFPLIFAGGPATFNPEPMTDFIDFFIIGDGEEVLLEILELIKNEKQGSKETRKQGNKEDLLLKLAKIPGIYVPRFYEPNKEVNYLPEPIDKFKNIIPEKIQKRVVSLSDYNQPTSGPVPYLASVQDRQIMEIRRGCDRGCRFCQPGYVYLPVRERTPDDLIKLSTEALKNTGYNEYSLLSLSASDYTRVHEVAIKLNDCHSKSGISMSMPSQRADRFDMQIANETSTVRKSGITLAPEAGTERLRAVINKGLKEIEIKRAIENVYDSGFDHVKLYFMIGLPTETTEDLDGIIELLIWACKLSKIKNKRPLEITCTISTFVPKAFTPFQWFSQNTQEEFQQKINYLKQKIREHKLRTVKLNCTEPKIALLEAALSRGDRRTSKLIYNAYKKGCKSDAWGERLNIDLWHSAALESELNLNIEATKPRGIGSVCPWEIIDTGLLKKFLIDEAKKAFNTVETSACTENTCHACGVCFELNVVNEVSVDKSKNNKFVKVKNQDSKLEVQSSEVNQSSVPISAPPSRSTLPVKVVQKVEIIHTKLGDLRFISHLDVQRLFERALRRAAIPFAFTQGFNPRPKMQWLMPLPIYYESTCELMHLELYEYINDSELQIALNKTLPPEFQLISAKTIDLNKKMPNFENVKVLYKSLTLSPYIWEKYICELTDAINGFLKQSSVIQKVSNTSNNKNNYNKVEKEIDLRAYTERIEITKKKPLELEFLLSGNIRVEKILNEVTRIDFNNNIISEKDYGWQCNWKIKKENIFSGV